MKSFWLWFTGLFRSKFCTKHQLIKVWQLEYGMMGAAYTYLNKNNIYYACPLEKWVRKAQRKPNNNELKRRSVTLAQEVAERLEKLEDFRSICRTTQ